VKMMPPGETIKQYYRVDSREISFFRFILEGYDGLAVLTTLDARRGQVVLSIAPGCEQDVAAIIRGLKSQMLIEPAQAPQEINGITAENRNDNQTLLY